MPLAPKSINALDLMQDESYFDCLQAITNASVESQRPVVGEDAPISVDLAVSAMNVIMAMLIEANPLCRTNQKMRQFIDSQRDDILAAGRLFRSHFELAGSHMLETIGTDAVSINLIGSTHMRDSLKRLDDRAVQRLSPKSMMKHFYQTAMSFAHSSQ